MFFKEYTSEELKKLLVILNSGTPFSELEDKLKEEKINRLVYGVIQKFRRLSKKDPETWNPEKSAEYTREWQKQWYEKHKDKAYEYIEAWYNQHKDDAKDSYAQWRLKNKGKWQKFGNYLADLLKERYIRDGVKWYKVKAAKELGIHPSLLSHYLAGNRKPSEKILRSISETYNEPYETLEALIR